MVDDSDDPAPNATQTGNKSKLKYMNQLQDVANRMRDDIQIDLNDVEAVSTEYASQTGQG
jgi:DNA replication licensing factor MCM7